MYRKASGKIGFSFNRMIVNAQPNFRNDAGDIDLNPQQKDNLFRWQLSQQDPRILNATSFYLAGIVVMAGSEAQARRILSDLHKASILSSHPNDPTIYTDRITKHLPHQIPTLSLHRQRTLIVMLFFWEGELIRWNLLEQEMQEIRSVLGTIKDVNDPQSIEELKIALGKVETKRIMLPSMREAGQTQRETEIQDDEPPGYDDRTGTLGVNAHFHRVESNR